MEMLRAILTGTRRGRLIYGTDFVIEYGSGDQYAIDIPHMCGPYVSRNS